MANRRFRPVMIRILVQLALCVVLTSIALAQPKTESPVPLPVPFTPVVDNAHVIDSDTKNHLQNLYLELKQKADIEFAVLTVPTTGDQDIFDFSLAVARGWGIGSKEGEKNALLLVVAIKDRKYFTQVSDHLEGDLPDGLVGQIQREKLIPAFRRGDYSKGIRDTIDTYAAVLASQRNFKLEDVEAAPVLQATPSVTKNPPSCGICCPILVIIAVILILVAIRNRRGGPGGRYGGGGGGFWQGLLIANLLSNLAGSGSRGGSWGGGGSGWSGGGGFGGGGGGFGGGFGGGGSFGGGGAGGSW